MTRDHTVPRMYLKNFANDKNVLNVHSVADISKPFPATVGRIAAIKGFYWGLGPNGTQGNNMEGLLCDIEDGAAPTLRMLMRDGTGEKISWPLLPNTSVEGSCPKTELSWWIAAQMLRTTRQRNRLNYLVGGEPIRGGKANNFSSNNVHLQYIYEHIRSLAYLIYRRPWGFGLSHSDLITSDSPVVMFYGHDDEDQISAFMRTDIVVPLSYDRLLLLPGPDSIDAGLNEKDHVFEIDSQTGDHINQIIFDSADRFVFSHPEHAWDHSGVSLETRLPTPWVQGSGVNMIVKRKLRVAVA